MTITSITRFDAAHRLASGCAVLTMCSLALLLCGCGAGPTGNVAHWSGAVTLDGQALPADASGSITFRSIGSGGGQAVTVQITDGRYDSPQTPKGTVMAYFEISQPTGKTYFSDRVQKEIQETKSIVPDKHSQGIQVEVAENNSSANFEL